ncbi:MAG TPA: S8 family serine peptidase [Caldisericia bacterium]|nr:S8 family serine peptidase [Caldisericia bacterium]HPF49100.1 S8 family serine peptidase [Caldisericia bacterium]HPI83036.1 S8 family serine peptidase [Caldisericia bacterium]HPQ92263.1 S8 family serine peptidase [Caldisericia bacterium]HRV74639.1 S8 family serine peptidase [Caldisericia bacterium]
MRFGIALTLSLLLVFSAVGLGFAGTTAGNVDVMIALNSSAPVDFRDTSVLDVVRGNAQIALVSASEALTDLVPDAQIVSEIDYLFCGLIASVPFDSISRLENARWVKDVTVLGHLVPSSLQSTSDMVNGSAVYNLTDKNGKSVQGLDILVGVIDSGIDYNHKHLGDGAMGQSSKVVGGVNYVNKDQAPLDDTPISHGTSVAGLIASDNTSVSVAPKAKLMSYKVYSNYDREIKESTVVSAIDQAAKDGCHVINISLSEPGGSSGNLSAAAKTAQKAVESGIVVVAAAGDFGTYCNRSDKGTVGGAGLAPDAICVGSMDARAIFNVKVDGANFNFTGLSPVPYIQFDNKTTEIIDAGFGSESELDGLRIRGKYVLVERGPSIGRAIPFYQKVLNAKKKGAIGVICWNNTPGELVQMQLDTDYQTGEKLTGKDLIPACFLSNTDGSVLRTLLKDKSVSVVISEGNNNILARTTSIGPTEDLKFKPDVCAPGIGLVAPISLNPAMESKIPHTNSFSGTSASTAIVSGAAALIKQMHPDWYPSDIRLALMNTSSIVRNVVNGTPSSFLIQGAGRIDIHSAINAPAVVSPGGVIAKPSEKVSLQLTGMGKAESFEVSVEVPDAFSSMVEFEISETSISVPEDGIKNVEITPFFNQAKIPCNIECVVWFTAGATKLHVPFICWKGFAASERRNVTNFTATGNKIDYSVGVDGITVEYNVAMGDLYSYKPFAYGDYYKADMSETNQTVLSSCRIDIVDGNNDTWKTIRKCENIEYGHYKFDWDGLVGVGGEKLPNGNYKLKLAWEEARVVESGTEKMIYTDTIVSDGDLTVTGSNVPAPAQFHLYSRPTKPTVDQKFVIDLYLTHARDVSSLSLDIVYPIDEIEILDIRAGDFLRLDGAAVEEEIFMEEEEGRIKIFAKRLSDKGIDGHGLIARFVAKCSDVVFPTAGYDNKKLIDSKGESISHMSFPLKLDITDEEQLVGDLNFDGIVDYTDIVILSRSYGLTREHPDYNLIADINDDGKVDDADLEKLIANYGKGN